MYTKYQYQGVRNNGYPDNFASTVLANVPILYPLKASEKPMVFWCFQGV